MPRTYSLHVPDIARRVLASQAREGQQKDELCGPFWVVAAVTALTGRMVTQDDAAVAAGTLLTAGGGSLDDLPPGAVSRGDYMREITSTHDRRLAGTSPHGIVSAISELSGGEVTAMPVSGRWGETTVDALADLVLGDDDAVAILNVATQHLWDSHLGVLNVVDYLDGADVRPAGAEWQVGHYVAIVGSLTGSHRRLLMCADTYPSLGTRGMHVQAAGCLAAALNRDGAPTSGGAIVAVRADRAGKVHAWAAGNTLEVDYWDNGVPGAEGTGSVADAGSCAP